MSRKSHKKRYDSAYKNIFSHPRMVEDLLRGYVGEAWVNELDYTTLEIYSGNHISDYLDVRMNDIIWRIRRRDEERWCYIYLLLEFQRENDPWMALRILTYIGLLYQSLIKHKQVEEGQKLPPIFPIVVYNGQSQWSAARDLRDLIEEVPDELKKWLPSQRYHLLDEGRVAERLKDNRVNDLIELENRPNLAQIQRVITRLSRKLAGDEHRELRRAITVWLYEVVLQSIIPKGKNLPKVNELSEVKTMLAERAIEWTQEWMQKGVQKGMQKGMQEGIQKGKHTEAVKMLQRQILRRFGLHALDEARRQQMAAASLEELERWGDNFVDAQSVEEVFR
jgi:predicted transposase/invertase (TIGR01784 family)